MRRNHSESNYSKRKRCLQRKGCAEEKGERKLDEESWLVVVMLSLPPCPLSLSLCGVHYTVVSQRKRIKGYAAKAGNISGLWSLSSSQITNYHHLFPFFFFFFFGMEFGTNGINHHLYNSYPCQNL